VAKSYSYRPQWPLPSELASQYLLLLLLDVKPRLRFRAFHESVARPAIHGVPVPPVADVAAQLPAIADVIAQPEATP